MAIEQLVATAAEKTCYEWPDTFIFKPGKLVTIKYGKRRTFYRPYFPENDREPPQRKSYAPQEYGLRPFDWPMWQSPEFINQHPELMLRERNRKKTKLT